MLWCNSTRTSLLADQQESTVLASPPPNTRTHRCTQNPNKSRMGRVRCKRAAHNRVPEHRCGSSKSVPALTSVRVLYAYHKISGRDVKRSGTPPRLQVGRSTPSETWSGQRPAKTTFQSEIDRAEAVRKGRTLSRNECRACGDH